jgi:16S rRNA (adenine1518-N6/adenine1519-N6)-dimethyltransferase
VESSVVEFVPYEKNILDIDEIDKKFFGFLNELFQFPRKTVRNNIKHLIKNNLNKTEHFFSKRPRELSIEEMYQLYREVYHE